ncbi:MAG: restriction endonuclease subunit S, partial [Actinomycetota bacterium]|nr:restriction endonuclease subunit S [Actinomycetota bacterium]
MQSGLADGWQIVRFDSFLARVERKVMVSDENEYSTVGVRWYGNGAFVRDHLLGADISRKQQWIVEAGDVVYNKLFAWKGSFAIADSLVSGHLVSDKFPTYRLDESQVDAEYLGFYFRSPRLAYQAEILSKGAAAISKLTLNPPQFWDLTMPLPPLPEQRRIVELLRAAEDAVSEARRLRVEAASEVEALVTSAIGNRLGRFDASGHLRDVMTGKPRNGWSAPCDNADGGTAVLSLGAVTGFTYRPTEFKRTSEPTTPDGHYWLRAGDLLITRSNTEKLVGHAAMYSGVPSPCIYPDLMMRIPVDESVALTRFVYYWLRTPGVRSILERAGSGTSSSMKKITQQDVMNLPFPSGVSIVQQQIAVDELDAIVDRVEELRS